MPTPRMNRTDPPLRVNPRNPDSPLRPERPCAKCGKLFRQTAKRRVLCYECFRHAEDD